MKREAMDNLYPFSGRRSISTTIFSTSDKLWSDSSYGTFWQFEKSSCLELAKTQKRYTNSRGKSVVEATFPAAYGMRFFLLKRDANIPEFEKEYVGFSSGNVST